MRDTATPPPAFGRPLLMRGGEKNSPPGKEGCPRSGRVGPALACNELPSNICENIDSKQLREKLEGDPVRPRHLLTEIGVGYRLMTNE